FIKTAVTPPQYGKPFTTSTPPLLPHPSPPIPKLESRHPLPFPPSPAIPKLESRHPSSVPSSTEAYNFHFGFLNCVRYGAICGDSRVNIQRYPTFHLYKDGKFVETYDTGTISGR
ncbi:hypothetical protein RUND412_006342, partial [Rhizina undulata]